MKPLPSLTLGLLLATTALADTPLDGDKLDTFTLGQSYVIWADGGDPYGITVFHPNRTVTWLRYGDECVSGRWAEPEPGLICFEYPTIPSYPCWHFFRQGNTLRLHFDGDPEQVYFYGPPGPATSPCGAPMLS